MSDIRNRKADIRRIAESLLPIYVAQPKKGMRIGLEKTPTGARETVESYYEEPLVTALAVAEMYYEELNKWEAT